MANEPIPLNTRHRFGHKDDPYTWKGVQEIVFRDIKPKFDAKVYQSVIGDGLKWLRTTGFSSVEDLNKIHEVQLAVFYYVGAAYHALGMVTEAVPYLQIAHSQARFEEWILPDFRHYPSAAGRLLATSVVIEHDSTAAEIESFLRGSVGKSEGGCFIVTAAFGDRLAPEVLLLSSFRDRHLVKSAIGRCAVRLYYAVSPCIALVVSQSSVLRWAARVLVLRPAIRVFSRRGDEPFL